MSWFDQCLSTKLSLRVLDIALTSRELVLLLYFVVWTKEVLLSRATVSAQTQVLSESWWRLNLADSEPQVRIVKL